MTHNQGEQHDNHTGNIDPIGHINNCEPTHKLYIDHLAKSPSEYNYQLSEVITATKESMTKWQSIIQGIGIDAHSNNCSLCKYFYTSCIYCPYDFFFYDCMRQKNAYSIWDKHHCARHSRFHFNGQTQFERKRMVFCPTCRKLAQDILDQLTYVLDQLIKE